MTYLMTLTLLLITRTSTSGYETANRHAKDISGFERLLTISKRAVMNNDSVLHSDNRREYFKSVSDSVINDGVTKNKTELSVISTSNDDKRNKKKYETAIKGTNTVKFTKHDGHETSLGMKADEPGEWPTFQNKDKNVEKRTRRAGPTNLGTIPDVTNRRGKGQMKHESGSFGKRRTNILNEKVLCSASTNTSSTFNTSDDCIHGVAGTNNQGHLIMLTSKYLALAFPFVINIISIIFHRRRSGNTHSSMYVITMNVIETICVLLGFLTTVIYTSEYLSLNPAPEQLVGSYVIRYVDSWVKQGSYLTHFLLTVERFQIVKYPLRYRNMFNFVYAKRILFPTIAFLLISHCIGVSVSLDAASNINHNLFSQWNIISGVLFVIFPVMAIVVLKSATCIVFMKENRKIRTTFEQHTSDQLLSREKRLTNSLIITTMVLTLTSAPSSVWVMFLRLNETPSFANRIVTELLLTFSYFGNGISFIFLMALNQANNRKCCMYCFPAKVTSNPVSTKMPLARTGNRNVCVTVVGCESN